jgi:hypothetical protein
MKLAVALSFLTTVSPLAPLACASDPPPKPIDPTTTAATAAVGCPLGVEGARVTVEDTADGVALTFTTLSRVDELRTRARTAAEMHGAAQQQGTGHDGLHGQGGHHGLHAMHLPPATGTVQDVADGARILLVPLDLADLARLREHARDGAARVQKVCD